MPSCRLFNDNDPEILNLLDVKRQAHAALLADLLCGLKEIRYSLIISICDTYNNCWIANGRTGFPSLTSW